MNHHALYRRRNNIVYAMRWTEETPVADLYDFTDGFVDHDDSIDNFTVYDTRHRRWMPFEYGDWIVDDNGTQFAVSNEDFERHYERDPDAEAEHPRGTDQSAERDDG